MTGGGSGESDPWERRLYVASRSRITPIIHFIPSIFTRCIISPTFIIHGLLSRQLSFFFQCWSETTFSSLGGATFPSSIADGCQFRANVHLPAKHLSLLDQCVTDCSADCVWHGLELAGGGLVTSKHPIYHRGTD